jgi:hypothetical protein
MLLMIEGLESQLRDQFLKQNDQLKRITQLSKIEEKETMILERLDRLEQRLIAGGINNNMQQPNPKIYHGYDIIYNYNIR